MHSDSYKKEHFILYCICSFIFHLFDTEKCKLEPQKCVETGGDCIQKERGGDNNKCLCKEVIYIHNRFKM